MKIERNYFNPNRRNLKKIQNSQFANILSKPRLSWHLQKILLFKSSSQIEILRTQTIDYRYTNPNFKINARVIRTSNQIYQHNILTIHGIIIEILQNDVTTLAILKSYNIIIIHAHIGKWQIYKRIVGIGWSHNMYTTLLPDGLMAHISGNEKPNRTHNIIIVKIIKIM